MAHGKQPTNETAAGFNVLAAAIAALRSDTKATPASCHLLQGFVHNPTALTTMALQLFAKADALQEALLVLWLRLAQVEIETEVARAKRAWLHEKFPQLAPSETLHQFKLPALADWLEDRCYRALGFRVREQLCEHWRDSVHVWCIPDKGTDARQEYDKLKRLLRKRG